MLMLLSICRPTYCPGARGKAGWARWEKRASRAAMVVEKLVVECGQMVSMGEWEALRRVSLNFETLRLRIRSLSVSKTRFLHTRLGVQQGEESGDGFSHCVPACLQPLCRCN